jgi:peptidoglycan hydrolase CwlO-like protein
VARSIEQKLETLAGLQKEIEKHLRNLEDNDLHYTFHRTKEQLHQLLVEIDRLNKMAGRLAHAVALLSDEESSPLWVKETYREWERGLQARWFPA